MGECKGGCSVQGVPYLNECSVNMLRPSPSAAFLFINSTLSYPLLPLLFRRVLGLGDPDGKVFNDNLEPPGDAKADEELDPDEESEEEEPAAPLGKT